MTTTAGVPQQRREGSASAAAEATPATGTFHDAWQAALAALELDVDLAEAMLTLDRIAENPPDPWAPPVHLPPLPLALADRARSLLGRQLEVSRRLAEAAAMSRRHLQVATTVRATSGPAVPVYLDVPA